MQAHAPNIPKYRFSVFYNDATRYPELGLFRQFADLWTWALYYKGAKVLEKKAEADAVVPQAGPDRLTILDCHRNDIAGNKALEEKAEAMIETLEKYGEFACLATAVLNLPGHGKVFTKYFEKFSELFQNGIFAPTGESADMYRGVGPLRRDNFGLKMHPEKDWLAQVYALNSEWPNKEVRSAMQRWFRRLQPWKNPIQNSEPQEIAHETIVTTIDLIACIFVPLVLMSFMFILDAIRSSRVCIAAIGVTGILFSLLLKGTAGQLTRTQIYTAISAYFAVATVFVAPGDAGKSQS